MPRIFDNIEKSLLPALQETLELFGSPYKTIQVNKISYLLSAGIVMSPYV